MLRWVVLAAVVAGTVTACDADGYVQPVTIKNDLQQAIDLRVCDSFSCDHLNDHVAPGQAIEENVDTGTNPYPFQIVDASGRLLGCLNIRTKPLPSSPVLVSTLGRCH